MTAAPDRRSKGDRDTTFGIAIVTSFSTAADAEREATIIRAGEGSIITDLSCRFAEASRGGTVLVDTTGQVA